MKPRAARRRFFGLLDAYGAELDVLTPPRALELMTRFHKRDRFGGCDPLLGHDILFCRWGPRHLERGDWFDLSVGRQLTDGSKIGRSIRQLRVSFRYTLDDELEHVGSASEFCRLPGDADAFRHSVTSTAVFRTIIERHHAHVDL
ncbi:MAG: hypothetical protein M3552_02260, partial [Planctomycetota bacterium]|nr:hypothetical protein [Planctomycetota bacterium]